LYRAVKFSLAKHRDIDAAKSDLEKAVQAVLTEGYQVENPITRARGRIKLEEHATPDQRVILDEVAALRSRVDQLSKSTRKLQQKSRDRNVTEYRFEVLPDGITTVNQLAGRLHMHFGSRAVVTRNAEGTLEVKSSEEISGEINEVPGVSRIALVGVDTSPSEF
jgi:hypothetical protein